MSVDPMGPNLANPMEKNEKGELEAKKRYSVIESINWYSYCSNNPLNYIDPSGMVEVDHDNKIIYAELENIEDMDKAYMMYSGRGGLGELGYTFIATNNKGYGFGFENSKQVLEFLEAVNPTTIDFGDIGDLASYASLALTVAGIASIFIMPAAAAPLFAASSTLDLIAGAAYTADGDLTSAAFSFASGAMGKFINGPKFIANAGRFARPSSQLFMRTNAARLILTGESLISPLMFGADRVTDSLME